MKEKKHWPKEKTRQRTSARFQPTFIARFGTLLQVKAEKEKRLQQLPPEAQGLIADPSRMAAGKEERDRRIQERLAQRQRRLEELQRMRMSRGIAKPGAVAPPERSEERRVGKEER